MHAIRAAHAFDGSRFLSGGATVLIEGDRIVGVESGRVALPAGVEVAEHAGTVLPGLIDCHTHVVADCTFGGLERTGGMTDDDIDAVIVESLHAHASAGVTTVRDLGDIRYRTLAFRDVPGLPRVVASGPPITTPDGHCHFLGGAVRGMLDAELRAAVAERAERGVDVVKVMASGGARRTRRPSAPGRTASGGARPLARRDGERFGGRCGRDRALHRPVDRAGLAH
jgi:imidazolonepropionase-like amidohydrolase